VSNLAAISVTCCGPACRNQMILNRAWAARAASFVAHVSGWSGSVFGGIGRSVASRRACGMYQAGGIRARGACNSSAYSALPQRGLRTGAGGLDVGAALAHLVHEQKFVVAPVAR